MRGIPSQGALEPTQSELHDMIVKAVSQGLSKSSVDAFVAQMRELDDDAAAIEAFAQNADNPDELGITIACALAARARKIVDQGDTVAVSHTVAGADSKSSAGDASSAQTSSKSAAVGATARHSQR